MNIYINITNIMQEYTCDNNITNKLNFITPNECPFNNIILYTKPKRTNIIPEYLALKEYNINSECNKINLCSICHDNYINRMRSDFPYNNITYDSKYRLLALCYPDLVLNDTIYRRERINYINKKKFTHEQLKLSLTIMDVDGDKLIYY